MNIHKIILGLMLTLAFALQSCEEDVVGINPGGSEPKLAVFSFISPQDTLLLAEVRKTQPAIGRHLTEEELKVKNATVVLSDGQQNIRLLYHAALDKYIASAADFQVAAGETYTITVTTPDGHKIEGSCVVPVVTGIEITDMFFKQQVRNDYGHSLMEHKFSYKWQDAPGVANFYRATAYRTYTIEVYGGQRYENNESPSHDYYKAYTSDAQRDGSILNSLEFTYTTANPDPTPKPYKLYAVLVVADKGYYLYHQSVDKQSYEGDNPFGEPILVHGNLKGGLGVFAAYNQVVREREVR